MIHPPVLELARLFGLGAVLHVMPLEARAANGAGPSFVLHTASGRVDVEPVALAEDDWEGQEELALIRLDAADRCRQAGMRTPVLRRTCAGPVLAVVGEARWSAQEHIEGRRFTGSAVEADIWLAEQAGLLHRLDPWPDELDLAGPQECQRQADDSEPPSEPGADTVAAPSPGPGAGVHPDLRIDRVLGSGEVGAPRHDLTEPAGWERTALQGARLDRSWASALGRRAHELDALERWSRAQSLCGVALCNLDLTPDSILVDDEEQWWVRWWSSADLDHPHNEIGTILLRHLDDADALVRIAAAYGQARGEPVPAEPELFAAAVAERLASLGLLTWLDSDDGDLGDGASGGYDGSARSDGSVPILDLIDGIPHMSVLERAADLAARAGVSAARTMGA